MTLVFRDTGCIAGAPHHITVVYDEQSARHILVCSGCGRSQWVNNAIDATNAEASDVAKGRQTDG